MRRLRCSLLRDDSRHALTQGFRITILQRRRQGSRQLVDLCLGNDQWRANKHRVRGGAEEKAAIHRALLYQGPYTGGRRQRRATGLVRDNVNRADQPDAPCLADQRMVGKRLQLLLQIWPDLPDLGEDVPLLVDFQGLDGDRCGYRVSGVGEAVSEVAELSGMPGY